MVTGSFDILEAVYSSLKPIQLEEDGCTSKSTYLGGYGPIRYLESGINLLKANAIDRRYLHIGINVSQW